MEMDNNSQMNFDEAYTVSYGENSVEYGYVAGDNRLVYIKAGMGGGFEGDRSKYLRIARRLNERYGCSVVSVSNPAPLPIAIDKAIIDDLIHRHGIHGSEISFFGHSNGGVKGLELSCVGIGFKKMVLVNMPLMINFHKTVDRIKATPKTRIIAVYGEYDPSYKYIPFLERKGLSNVEIVKFQGVDHNFEGRLDEFVELADRLMS
ncbi:MAG: hypothetical protein IJW53_03020 [Clostridia bacterium]|nr:hypothetical protein [Clostridia bacterium]